MHQKLSWSLLTAMNLLEVRIDSAWHQKGDSWRLCPRRRAHSLLDYIPFSRSNAIETMSFSIREITATTSLRQVLSYMANDGVSQPPAGVRTLRGLRLDLCRQRSRDLTFAQVEID
jgi:hypothetical protein